MSLLAFGPVLLKEQIVGSGLVRYTERDMVTSNGEAVFGKCIALSGNSSMVLSQPENKSCIFAIMRDVSDRSISGLALTAIIVWTGRERGDKLAANGIHAHVLRLFR